MEPFRGSTGHLVVVGSGVIGLTIAWQAAQSGYRVTVVDGTPARGASRVAAGMLAPLAEAWPGEDDVLALGWASLARWPAFADELHRASEIDPRLSAAGTVLVAVDSADAEVLGTLARHLDEHGHQVDTVGRRELRDLEPTLGPAVRSGLHLPTDIAVDSLRLWTALRTAAERAGVRFDGRDATEVKAGQVVLADGGIIDCDLTVIAAGAWSGELHQGLRELIRPVKGELLHLRARQAALPPPARTVRALVEGRPLYLVPRGADELVVGATQYEAGFDGDVTVGGVRDLVRDAERVLPGVAEYALVECLAGFRAGSTDNLPVIGWVEPGVLVAAGHHRNGLLAAPITSAAVLALASDDQPPAEARAADPARHAAAAEPRRNA